MRSLCLQLIDHLLLPHGLVQDWLEGPHEVRCATYDLHLAAVGVE